MPRVEKKSVENTESAYLVPELIHKYHVALKSTRGARKGRKPNEDGLIYVCREIGCSIMVSPKLWDRATRIAHTLLLALEHRGHRILPEHEMKPGLVVEVKGHQVGFDIREALRQERNTDSDFGWQRVTLHPKGLLSVRLYSGKPDGYAESTIVEGKTWVLEDRIEDIAERFERVADKMEQRRLQRARWEQERLKDERRQQRREAVVERRKKLDQSLRDVVASVKLIDDALTAARTVRESNPDSRWAIAVATWMERATKRLASPRLLAKQIPVEAWVAMGMPTRNRRL